MDSKEKIKLVKELRDRTGLPIAECTKILEQNHWKMDNLTEIINKYNTKLAQKKQDRETKEGKIFVLKKEHDLFYLLVMCETDFVASNEKFNEFGNHIIKLISEGHTDFQLITEEYIAKIGEKIALGEHGKIKCNYHYLHQGKKLAAVDTSSHDESFNKRLCFHIVSMAEIYDMSNVEELLKQTWFESEKKTVKDILHDNNVIVNNIFYFE